MPPGTHVGTERRGLGQKRLEILGPEENRELIQEPEKKWPRWLETSLGSHRTEESGHAGGEGYGAKKHGAARNRRL